MNKKISYALKVILIAIIVCFLWKYIHVFSDAEGSMISVKNWEVILNGEEYANMDTLDCAFETIKKGDEVVCKTVLEDYDIESPAMLLHIYHSVINIYLDDEQIYTYGKDVAEKGDMTGAGYFFVNIPVDYAGKTLTIHLDVCENDETTLISGGKIQKGTTIVREFIRSNFFEIILIGFIAVFVVLCLAGYIMNASLKRESRILLYMCLLFTSVGTWLFCYKGLSVSIDDRYELWSFIEYITLYLTPLCMLLFVTAIIIKRKAQIPVYIMVGVHVVYTVFVLIMHFNNIRHIEQFLTSFHLIGCVSVVVILVCMVINFRDILRRRRIRKEVGYRELYVFVIGIVLTVVLVGFDIARYNIVRYLIDKTEARFGAVTIAVVCLIITMLITYISMLTSRHNESVERMLLERLAYVDTLTQIPNRARCEDEINNLDNKMSEGIDEAAIIFLDLNDFKSINDTYGHSMGDDALKEFADIISKSFEGKAFVGRMSGDEFIIIFRNTSRKVIDKYMDKFEKNIAKCRMTSNKSYKISTAYGIAYREKNHNVSGWDLYKEADSNMYDMKEQMKKEREQ